MATLITLTILLTCLLAGTVYLLLRESTKTKKLRSELQRFDFIKSLDDHKLKLHKQIKSAKELLPPLETLADMEKHRLELDSTIESLKQNEVSLTEQLAEERRKLQRLQVKTAELEEQLEVQSFGLYEPRYDFNDSERYAQEIKTIRAEQKRFVKEKTATHCSQEWAVEGDARKGLKMIQEHAKLMLRAFNYQCDATILKVRYNNIETMEKRINNAFDQVNKLGQSKSLFITNAYLRTKLKELYLVHEYRDQLNYEKEERRLERERLREEAKARQEIEQAKKLAEEEQSAKEEALKLARADLAKAHDAEKDQLNGLIAKLESELQSVLERKERAISRAQLTRSGHVYIISNIGVFGEKVFKIGMTRRLEPLDRVKELGDASVPFPFDVHAMIFSDDAPALEKALHKAFNDKRLNLVNLRKEFFQVELSKIKTEVLKDYPNAKFAMFPEAEDYRKSIAKRTKMNAINMPANSQGTF